MSARAIVGLVGVGLVTVALAAPAKAQSEDWGEPGAGAGSQPGSEEASDDTGVGVPSGSESSGEASRPRAPAAEEKDPAPQAERPWRLSYDMAFFTRSELGTSLSVISWILKGRYETKNFAVEVDLPFAWAKTETSGGGIFGPSSDKGAQMGNLSLSALYTTNLGSDEHFEGGAIIALPTGAADVGEPGVADGGGAIRGLRDIWLWSTDLWGFAFPARFERVHDSLGVGIEGALGVLLGTGDLEVDPIGLFQARGWIGYASDVFRAGAQVLSVSLFNSDNTEHQASIGPFAKIELDRAFGGIEGIINLDEPFGYIDNGSEVWGVRVFAGVKM